MTQERYGDFLDCLGSICDCYYHQFSQVASRLINQRLDSFDLGTYDTTAYDIQANPHESGSEASISTAASLEGVDFQRRHSDIPIAARPASSPGAEGLNDDQISSKQHPRRLTARFNIVLKHKTNGLVLKVRIRQRSIVNRDSARNQVLLERADAMSSGLRSRRWTV
jgi:hypothetical protein